MIHCIYLYIYIDRRKNNTYVLPVWYCGYSSEQGFLARSSSFLSTSSWLYYHRHQKNCSLDPLGGKLILSLNMLVSSIGRSHTHTHLGHRQTTTYCYKVRAVSTKIQGWQRGLIKGNRQRSERQFPGTPAVCKLIAKL